MKKFFEEFKAFISRGNVLDLAVATIIGASFSQIVTSFTNGIIMPLVSLLFKAENLDKLVVVLRKEQLDASGEVIKEAITWQYGTLIQAVINFIIIAFFLFVLIRLIGKVRATLDFNANMKVVVQKKFDNGEELNDIEKKWYAMYSKKNPDDAPKRKEETVETEVQPEVKEPTEKEILQEILNELKKGKTE